MCGEGDLIIKSEKPQGEAPGALKVGVQYAPRTTQKTLIPNQSCLLSLGLCQILDVLIMCLPLVLIQLSRQLATLLNVV